MTTSAGFQLEAGRIPGEEIAYEELASDSDTFGSAEVEIMTIDADVVEGRTYRVEWFPCVNNDTDDQTVQVRVREDTSGGNSLGTVNYPLGSSAGSGTGFGCYAAFRYTADATETKTFVGTCDGFGATPADDLYVESVGPSWIRVTYVSG